jgi:two-component system phosphate regulon sensor histidine kinase PhoR
VNLLQNAREALGERGNVSVTAASRRDHSVEISVSDDGSRHRAGQDRPGVRGLLHHQGNAGTGLGLAIVKHNVELYGGSVHVESELGKGANLH